MSKFSDEDFKSLDITNPEFHGLPPVPPSYEEQKADSTNETQSISAKLTDTIKHCKESLDFFAAFMMPDIFKYLFPPVFLALWSLLIEKASLVRDFTKIAVGLPRGLGKTTLMKLFILYLILFTDRHFISIYSSREGLAVNILSDVKDFLGIFNVKSVFGDWQLAVETDTKQQLTFAFRGRDIIITALGAGTSMRGMNLKNRRPDVMIFDDVQTEECAKSEVESDTLERWLIGTAMKAKDNERCLFIYIGNMYPYPKTCILAKLKYNPEWVSFINGAITKDRTSIWEEMKPMKDLMAEFRSDIAMGHPEIFFAEVLNDENAGQKHGVDLKLIPDVPYIEGVDLPEGKFIIIDPAASRNKKSDNVEIGYFELFDRIPVAKKFISGKLSPGDTIKSALGLAMETGTPIILVEDVAYQSTLLYWFEIVIKLLFPDMECGIKFSPINPHAKAKTGRILNMFKQLLPSKFEPHIPEIYLDKEVRAEVYMEITNYNPNKPVNLDNKLDCLAYAPQAVEENYWDMMTVGSILQTPFDSAKVLTLQENCPF